jgi:hypothetical protein
MESRSRSSETEASAKAESNNAGVPGEYTDMINRRSRSSVGSTSVGAEAPAVVALPAAMAAATTDAGAEAIELETGSSSSEMREELEVRWG